MPRVQAALGETIEARPWNAPRLTVQKKKLRWSVRGAAMWERRDAKRAEKKNIAYRQPRSLDSPQRSGIKSFRWFYALISSGWSRGYPLYNTYTLTESSTALADLDSPASTSRSSSPEELRESALPPTPSLPASPTRKQSASTLRFSSASALPPFGSQRSPPTAHGPMCFRASRRPSTYKVDESIYRSTQRALRYGKVDFDNLVTLYCIFIQFHGH